MKKLTEAQEEAIEVMSLDSRGEVRIGKYQYAGRWGNKNGVRGPTLKALERIELCELLYAHPSHVPEGEEPPLLGGRLTPLGHQYLNTQIRLGGGESVETFHDRIAVTLTFDKDYKNAEGNTNYPKGVPIWTVWMDGTWRSKHTVGPDAVYAAKALLKRLPLPAGLA
jgi:hypothetical protein